LQPAPGSALSALTQDRTWQAHAERFNVAFGRVKEHQLKHIRGLGARKADGAEPGGSTFSAGRTSSMPTHSSRMPQPTCWLASSRRAPFLT
jgi:hypothetical protein